MLFNMLVKFVESNNVSGVVEILHAKPKIKFTVFRLSYLFHIINNGTIMKILLNYFDDEKCSDINYIFKINSSILISAISKRIEIEIIKEIVTKGCNINYVNSHGMTPLRRSVSTCDLNYIEEILKLGADVNKTYDDNFINKGISLLHFIYNNDIIKLLIKYGANVNAKNENGLTPLMVPFNEDIIFTLINCNANVNTYNKKGETPLMLALHNNRSLELIKYLIIKGADVNAEDEEGQTPIIYALKFTKDIEYITVLLQNGANVNGSKINPLLFAMRNSKEKEILFHFINNGACLNVYDDTGLTPLMYTILKPYYKDLFDTFIKIGADVNFSNSKGITPICCTIIPRRELKEIKQLVNAEIYENRYQERSLQEPMYSFKTRYVEKFMDKLINTGAKFHSNSKDVEGRTWLMIAIDTEVGVNTICKMINNGQNINAIDINGCTPLIYSIKNYVDEEVAEYLVDLGADVNLHGTGTKTPLMYAIKYSCSLKFITKLIDKGANINVQDEYKMCALFYALFKNKTNDGIKIVRTLFSKGVDLNVCYSNHTTPLMYALKNDCSEDIIIDLIEKETDFNRKDKFGKTALMFAVYENYSVEIVNILIMKGSNVNCKDECNLTPLMYALYNNSNKECIINLINKGADVNFNDDTGKTALMYALENYNNEAIINELINRGAKINESNFFGKTVLMYALENNVDKEIIKKILIGSSDLNLSDKKGRTALFCALYNSVKDKEILSELIIRSDINKYDNSNLTPLLLALKLKYDDEIILLLINDFRIEINKCDINRKTPLMYAITKCYSRNLIKEFLRMGANVNASTNHGTTTLHFALKKKLNRDIILDLISEGAYLDKSDNSNDKQVMCSLKYNNENETMIVFQSNETVTDKSNRYKVTPLFYAMIHNYDKEVIMKFIENIPDINEIWKDGITPLIYCCKYKRYIELIDEFINRCVYIDKSDNEGKSALMYALENGIDSKIIKFIENGADVNKCDSDGISPLMFALKAEINRDVINCLVENGARINHHDRCNKSVLCYAIDNKAAIDNIKEFMRYAGDFNLICYQKNILLYAMQKRVDKEIIIFLIKNGADVKKTNEDGGTLLFYAIYYNYDMEVVKELVNNGVNSNNINHKLILNSFHYLYKREFFNILLPFGGNFNVPDENGKTPLMIALEKEMDVLIVAELFNYLDDINKVDNFNKCLLMYLLEHDIYNEFFHMLIYAGADVFSKDIYGNDLLHYVNNKDLLNLLIDKDIPINVVNNKGYSPLMKALVEQKDIKIIKTILKSGGNPNCLDCNLNSPLHFATNEEQIDLLITYGANLFAENEDGIIPGNFQAKYKSINTAKYYIKHYLLISLENEIENLNHFYKFHELYHEFINYTKDYIVKCKSELKRMKNKNFIKKLSFYSYCCSKKSKPFNILLISNGDYLYNNEQIKELFPIYSNLILMKREKNKTEMQKYCLIRYASSLILSSNQLTINCNTFCNEVYLDYDSIFNIAGYLQYSHLCNLLLAAM